jgi:hypothetical protein
VFSCIRFILLARRPDARRSGLPSEKGRLTGPSDVTDSAAIPTASVPAGFLYSIIFYGSSV